jgi:hypothetical protein
VLRAAASSRLPLPRSRRPGIGCRHTEAVIVRLDLHLPFNTPNLDGHVAGA